MKTHDTVVLEVYEAKFKALKLAPAYVGQLKKHMLAVSKKSKRDKTAITKAGRAWVKSKQKASKSKQAKGAKKKDVRQNAATVGDKQKKQRRKKPVQKEPSLDGVNLSDKDVNTGDEILKPLKTKTLKEMAKDLKIKLPKGATDKKIRTLLSHAMVGMSPEIKKINDQIDSNKLPDCIGLLIDLTSVACIACSTKDQCRTLFQKHAATGFRKFKAAITEVKTKEEAAKTKPEDIPAASTTKKKALSQKKKLTKYNPTRKLSVFDVQNPEDKGSHAFDFIQDILDEVPETLSALRSIIEQHFEPADGTKPEAHVIEIALSLEELNIIEIL